MIRLQINESKLVITLSDKKRIDLDKAKELLEKGRRMVSQNRVDKLVIEVKKPVKISNSALELMEYNIKGTTEIFLNGGNLIKDL